MAIVPCTACARKTAPQVVAEPPNAPDYAVVIDNMTDRNVSVYIAEERSHTRIGGVQPRTESMLEVMPSFLSKGLRLRFYMFRGPEPCPVARVVDFTVSRTPRITVAAHDTVLSAYLPADGCRNARK